MKVLLGTLVLVLVAGCSSTGSKVDHAAASSPAPSQSAKVTAKVRWERARAALERSATGHFRSEATPEGKDVALNTQSGSFDLRTGSTELQSDVLTNDGTQTMTARVTAEGDGYLRMASWTGSWSGCWLPMDPSTLGAVGAGSDARAIVPVLHAVLSSEVTATAEAGRADEIDARVDAYLFLRALGLSGAAVESLAQPIKTLKVHVTLRVWEEPVVIEADFRGRDLSEAVARSGVPMSPSDRRLLGQRHAHVTIDNVGQPVAVQAPDPGLLLPVQAAKNDSCPANR